MSKVVFCIWHGYEFFLRLLLSDIDSPRKIHLLLVLSRACFSFGRFSNRHILRVIADLFVRLYASL